MQEKLESAPVSPQRIGGFAVSSFPETAAQPNVDVIDENRKQEIAGHPLLAELPEEERAEAAAQTFELYSAAKEYVAPVIIGFADYLLDEAGDRQIIFAGRDGIGPFIAANVLKNKFDYGNDDPEQNVYAYLTRKVVGSTPPDTMQDYLHQVGVHDTEDSILLADIGMYGTIVPSLQKAMPKVDVRYLISQSYTIPGYASGSDHEMEVFKSIIGNPAVHFMEDTFSGLVASPSRLVEQNGELVPQGADAIFPPQEALKREFALKAIQDYAESLAERPKQPAQEAIDKLDDFLQDHDSYSQLMVPHIR